jgi:hypothetical protein
MTDISLAVIIPGTILTAFMLDVLMVTVWLRSGVHR